MQRGKGSSMTSFSVEYCASLQRQPCIRIYTLLNFYQSFDPLPPCHCHKSADFVHFVFFGGTPTADVIYGSPLAPRASRAQSPASTIEELERPVRGGRFHELLKRRDREGEGERRRECLQKRGRREEGGISNISLTVHDRRRRIRRGFRGTFLP